MEKTIDPVDLKIKEQKRVIQIMVAKINDNDPTYYYMNTAEVANLIHDQILMPGSLSKTNLDLVMGLSPKDIQILLSYN